ncbi:hypothetical protein VC83_08423 [Pseudogymnoascus destructans]|uniref:HNH nuclease domain-containing protein n=1 Tax=Pseudogymnoascus destructans TaxID=655981 RepID=A0A176ZZ82_9PEZI|nr:uncharacterized protein VC83_08423 [Pseudogymnoascus destructans]OAF55147.1 hypothetical protein VC83_08423 [Pseudogymnoascus destructans]
MPSHRIESRHKSDIHFLNSENDEISSAFQTGSLTWAEMSQRMDIVFELPAEDFASFRCLENGDPKDPVRRHGPPISLQANNNVIQPGFYVLLSQLESQLKSQSTARCRCPVRYRELYLGRQPLPAEKFRDQIRNRDGRCVITGRADPDFTALEAAHIFPLAHLELWVSGKWKQQLTDDNIDISESGIKSVQNGLLLDSSAHHFFNKYAIAIDPDNGYQVVSFRDAPQYENLTLIRRHNIPAKYQLCPALLKHHFHMAVLLNMKGSAGYPEWDEDYSKGCDQVAEISESDQGKLRFETVLAERLNHLLA